MNKNSIKTFCYLSQAFWWVLKFKLNSVQWTLKNIIAIQKTTAVCRVETFKLLYKSLRKKEQGFSWSKILIIFANVNFFLKKTCVEISKYWYGTKCSTMKKRHFSSVDQMISLSLTLFHVFFFNFAQFYSPYKLKKF